jgi:ATPase family AAA domain-containing protein 3A/B
MMVLATNRAEDLDSAVLDRMDESLYFPLPAPDLRVTLVSIYFKTYVTSHTRTARRGKEWRVNPRKALRWVLGTNSRLADFALAPPIMVESDEVDLAGYIDEKAERTAALTEAVARGEQAERAMFEAIAAKLEGFSGREIAKLMIAVQSAAYGSELNALGNRLLHTVVDSKVDEHQRKVEMVQTENRKNL